MSALTSDTGASFDCLPTGFDSIFLVVTGTFDFSETGLAADFGNNFSAGLAGVFTAGLTIGLATAFDSGLAFALVSATPLVLLGASLVLALAVLATVLCLAATVFAIGFVIDREEVDFVAATFAFFADAVWDLTGFFIAFAMGSATKKFSGLFGKCRFQNNWLDYVIFKSSQKCRPTFLFHGCSSNPQTSK